MFFLMPNLLFIVIRILVYVRIIVGFSKFNRCHVGTASINLHAYLTFPRFFLKISQEWSCLDISVSHLLVLKSR